MAVDGLSGTAKRKREAYKKLELAVIEAAPVEIERVAPNGNPDEGEFSWYDARLREAAVPGRAPVFGAVHIPVGTPVEIKTCRVRFPDEYATCGTRRGRWEIEQSNHRRLCAAGGVYLCAVREADAHGADAVVTLRFLPAVVMDALLESRWTNKNGNGGPSRQSTAQLPWSLLFDPVVVEGGDGT